jgi:uncharacterized protein YndB with AHSA1/START domain
MPVTVSSDPARLTLTAVGEYPVPVERLWAAWADPRQLEQIWGPPAWPGTVEQHALRPGARSIIRMTGPRGERVGSYWDIVAVDPPRGFDIVEGFIDADGQPDPGMPRTQMAFRFEPTATGSRFSATSTFASVEDMEQLVAMGMIEGLTEALGQLDALLADLRALAHGAPAALERIGDDEAAVERVIRGRIDQVWEAHQRPELLQRWLLGPPGWTMPVCEVAAAPGQPWRHIWENAETGERFGFEGELLAHDPPVSSTTTERWLGTEGPSTHNTLTLAPLPGDRTRLRVHIRYPSPELREMILGTGMVDGMEASYARLEGVLGGAEG